MRRMLATVAMGLAILVVTATPASAHSVAGQGSTNYASRIKRIEPHVKGLKVEIIEAGSRIKLSNDTGQTVTVFGYQGEPYLRIGSDGVFENVRSPAVYVNSVRNNPPAPPADADPKAEPRWRKVNSGTVARWHDHRAHWMGAGNPPIVRRAPGTFHVVSANWRLKMVVGSTPVTVTGDLDWVPGPSPIPWALLALGGAAVVIAGAFSSKAWRPVLAAATVVVIAADVVHTVGIAFVSQTSTTGRLVKLVTTTPYSVVAWILGVVALVYLYRQPLIGLYAASFAAIMIGGLGGLGDASDLYHSQVASWIGANGVRGAIALSIGLAIGIPVASFVTVWRGNVPRQLRTADAAPPVPVGSPAA